MNSFGQIKSKIESSMIKLYGKDNFKNHLKNFKKNIVENKDVAKIYYLYDDLLNKKGINEDIASDYVNESIEELRKLIEKNNKEIKKLDEWISSVLDTDVNNEYTDIDNVVYNTSIKMLESVLVSKNNIKKLITQNKETKMVSEISNVPLSSMLKIMTNTFNKEYSNISESEKNELKELLSLNKKEVKERIETLRESVKSKLQNQLNESEDKELHEKIELTMKKLDESNSDLISLYKLTQLDQGL